VKQSQAVMVASDAVGSLVGTYYLRPNSLALGAHMANAGYVVADHCRRQGIGSRLSPREGWLSDGRQVLHFKPLRYDRWSQSLEVAFGEVTGGEEPPLL